MINWILGLFKKEKPVVSSTVDVKLTSTRYSPQDDENFKNWLHSTFVSVRRSKKSPKNYTVYAKAKGYTISRHSGLHFNESELSLMGNLADLHFHICNGEKV